MAKKKNAPAKNNGCSGGCVSLIGKALLVFLFLGIVSALLPKTQAPNSASSTRQPTRVATMAQPLVNPTATHGRTLEPPELTRTGIPTLRHVGALPVVQVTNTPQMAALVPTATVTSSATSTTRPSRTPEPTKTPAPELMYVYSNQNVNARAEPSTTAAILASLPPGAAVEIIGSVDGTSVNGNTRWYHVRYESEPIYVHSSLLRDTAGPLPPRVQQSAPPTNPPSPPVQQQAPPRSEPQQQPVQQVEPPPQSTIPPPPPAPPVGGSPFQCNGIDDLNCSNFSSRAAAQAHLNACGNEDRLDGNDNDGLACESLP